MYTSRVSGDVDAPRAAVHRALVSAEAIAHRRVPVLAFETADPALGGAMTLTTTLTDAEGGGTEVLMVHEGLPDALPAAANETGTRMALANLARLVEADGPF
ncbi:SRPBCC domain-containing protein [Streptomyces massasporeus]|uniref:SRPBCC domain-containing protein n=1 Tax=Streptomyces massasporeus TaxID=67324 RepID=UPI003702ABAF